MNPNASSAPPVTEVPENLGYICSQVARTRPSSIALVDIGADGCERTLTYGELDERCNRVAHYLQSLGMQAGDRVFVLTGNRAEFVEIVFGAMRAGVVPVPANARGGAETLEHILADCGASVAIVDPDANSHVTGVLERHQNVMRIAVGRAPAGWLSHEQMVASAHTRPEPVAVVPQATAMLPYTSGSTGKPKGVVLTHGGQRWWLKTALRIFGRAFAADQKILVAVPLFHKNAMAGAIKPFLTVGGTVVVMAAFEPKRFLDALARHRCTQTTGVPTLYSMLLEHEAYARSLDLSAWKLMRIGSAPCDASLLERLGRTFNVLVSQGYGLTEGGPVMLGPPADGRPVPLGSCGVAWDEGEVKLMNPDGSEAKDFGELWVRNPGVTPGYYRLDELNKMRLRDGWLRTGDLFHRDANGFFFFKGRVDDMFVCGGENIYPIEVEAVLRKHPDVVDVCVVPVAHASKGEVPAAAVVCRSGSSNTEQALKEFYLGQGPAYSHPRRVLILRQMPMSGAGKIDRRAVRTLLENPQ